MGKKHLLIIFLIFIIFTACSQIEGLLTPIDELGAPSGTELVLVSTSTPVPPSPTAPTETPTISPTPTQTNTPKPTRTPRPTFTLTATLPAIIRLAPENIPDYVNPLTGLVSINPLALERRPIAIKIPNAPHSVRPQFGLSLADQVFEYHLEWGLTRFIAIFYGNDAVKVGPIRSGRIFDRHIMDMYNAILVFNGADKRVLEYFDEIEQNEDLFVVERECPPLCRDESFPPPHNLFGNTTLIHDYINGHLTENKRFDLATQYFYSLGAHGKDLVSRIYIDYSYANYAYWDFDKHTNRYYRYQGSVDLLNGQEEVYTPLTDQLNDQAIAADNVVVLFVPHEFYLQSSDTEIFEINLVDRGDAYIFRNGKAYQATWERREVNKPLYLLSPDGSNFPMKPGVTFFQILHTTSQTIKDDQAWTFIFERPEEE